MPAKPSADKTSVTAHLLGFLLIFFAVGPRGGGFSYRFAGLCPELAVDPVQDLWPRQPELRSVGTDIPVPRSSRPEFALAERAHEKD